MIFNSFRFVWIIILLFSCQISAQEVALYNQINGKIDFKLIGNTLNPIENTNQILPETLLSSSATLTLNPNDVIRKAYLYWAGCGTGDFNITLNNQNFTADRTFSNRLNYPAVSFDYFAAFKDITAFIATTGAGNYTLSNLDVSEFLVFHSQITTNFAGWAIVVVYENPSLSINQINIYDGLQRIPDRVTINLNSLNIIDNLDSKIGFISWEGDKGLAENETLRINGQILSNPPLNPANNAFNGTNSELGISNLFNMDLDIYPVQNNIQIGDQSALIELTSNQDVVLINTIITKFNSRLPDATIAINTTNLPCNSRSLSIAYTVSNLEGIEALPAQTPIAFYANNSLIGQATTLSDIGIGASENGFIELQLPTSVPNNFELKLVVDDTGNGTGIRSEIIEINNSAFTNISAIVPPIINVLANLESCNEGKTKATFDFSRYENEVKTNALHRARFYETRNDAVMEENPIDFSNSYQAIATPKEIFVRVDDALCYTIGSFFLTSKACPIGAISNYISANGDENNNTFFIEGLRDVFVNFRTEIYNRWGKLVWVGTNNSGDWDGLSNQNFRLDDASISPTGTYYYIVYLNDISYPEPLVGFLYLYKKK